MNAFLRTVRKSLLMVALALSSVATSACGLWHRVDRDLLATVPNDEKLLLFDAENGVYIARDELETAQRRIQEAERALLRARKYINVIDQRRDSGSGVDTPEVIQMLEDWNSTRIALRELEVELAERSRDVAEARLWTARAAYERAKAKLVKDKNPEEGASLEMLSFDDQVVDREQDEEQELAIYREKEAEVLALRDAYNALSLRLQEASRGAYGGPWADLVDE